MVRLWASQGLAKAIPSSRLFHSLNPKDSARWLTRANVQRPSSALCDVAADVYANPRHVGRGGWTW